MFTGIITDIGRIRAIEPGSDPILTIETVWETSRIALGASIACSGVCLTVTATGPGWFRVQVSGETLAVTTAARWVPGWRLNLEPALKVGDELGGHIVSGHVDGMGHLLARRDDGESLRLEIAVPPNLARFIAPKGSITVDGVSLTVNAVVDQAGGGTRFGVNLIPHTQAATTLGALAPGHAVNLEIDMLARYVARLVGRETP